MKPWCAEGEVPTAANLDLYRGWNSCVGWHSDDEPLFGECGDANLIVSVSLGSSALFRFRRQSCPYDEGHLCRLDHGEVLVMDGQCQDEFLHCTGCGREQERINITFRWIKQHVSSCPLLKAGWHAVCQRVRRVHQFLLWRIWVLAVFGLSCFSLVLCAFWVFTPSCVQGLGHFGVPPAGLALWVCSSCGHYLCDLWRANMAAHNTATHFSHFSFFRFQAFFEFWMPYLLALAGQPSLHGYDAFMVYWVQGALRRHRRLKYGKTFFFLYGFFCSVGILGYGFGDLSFGICGSGGPGILGLPLFPIMLVLRFSMLEGGSG